MNLPILVRSLVTYHFGFLQKEKGIFILKNKGHGRAF